MRILLLGSGGREHALAWKIAQSKKCGKLFIAPGNAGTEACGENVAIGVNEFEKLKTFAADNAIDMVVVGPEDPLVGGIYDDFRQDARTSHIPVIGPSKSGAVLEGSKDFAKGFMQRHSIPTAAYATFDSTTIEAGLKFLDTLKPPYVLKADGLADSAYLVQGKARIKADARGYVRQCVRKSRHRRVPVRHRMFGVYTYRWHELQDTSGGKRLQTHR